MRRFISCVCCLMIAYACHGQDKTTKALRNNLTNYLSNYHTEVKINTPKLSGLRIDHKTKSIDIRISDSFSDQPFRQHTVDSIYQNIKALLPSSLKNYYLTIYANNKLIEELIPNVYRNEKKDTTRMFLNVTYNGEPWVSDLSRPYNITRGLYNHHIAVCQSHGRFYKNEEDTWQWQRPTLYCTTEDMFTQSFVLPYLIPMLENAGAVVYTPRERDTQKNEVIVDNDTPLNSLYKEINGNDVRWSTLNSGFAQIKNIYYEGENPFNDGTCRVIPSTGKSDPKKVQAHVEWTPTLPEKGLYAVYVSYQTLPNSISNAQYTVYHNGGSTRFSVNQQIGGGTWVYLGTFEFDEGNHTHCKVTLTNESEQEGMVCADAVRFGGGMGNIERGGQTSGLPRYLEGARYYAQWAGMPYHTYAPREGENDYADDINARSHVINYLSGGSVFNPDEEGTGIPFEMVMALHSDAGYNENDTLIGTLGIYTTDFNEGKLAIGTDRYASRDLTDILMTNIHNDIQNTYRIPWMRRRIWNRNYSETRLPVIPSTIIELLSHQNFEDMKYGHDPCFKFIVSRAIYKGIVQFIHGQYNSPYVIQPLPVSHFAITFDKEPNTVQLSWKPRTDIFEPSARANGYIVYTRINDGGFDNGVYITGTHYKLKITPGIIYSFKIAAVNEGGESFPSEILTAYKASNEQGKVLIVNGFNRIAPPATVNTPLKAGFDLGSDLGVAYMQNLSFCGPQCQFDRTLIGKDEDEDYLGQSTEEYQHTPIAGNTFDYPFTHGKAIAALGKYSYSSVSVDAFENQPDIADDYPVMDYILGLQKNDSLPNRSYCVFSDKSQAILTRYCNNGGSVFASGAYIAGGMSETHSNRLFTSNVLKYAYSGSLVDREINTVYGLKQNILIPRFPNPTKYCVCEPDCLQPTAESFPVLLYTPSTIAAIAYKGDNYRTFIMGFPFESITDSQQQVKLMASILHFLFFK